MELNDNYELADGASEIEFEGSSSEVRSASLATIRSASFMQRAMIVNVGLAAPPVGKTELPAM
jgi:hypothetical protein